jgi:hypothetical protein
MLIIRDYGTIFLKSVASKFFKVLETSYNLLGREVNQMEIYSVEIDLGQLLIEVSVQHTSPRIRFNNCYLNRNVEDGFHVYLTAKDKNMRRIWRTPVIDDTGTVKRYYSIEEAMTDVNGRLKEKQIPF